ncbi:Nitrogen permease regulator 2, partial [Nowakowskiella sp. JEL0078]
MLPSTISRDLLQGKVSDPQSYESVTIMFSDVVGFSNLCSKIAPVATVEFLNDLYKEFDDVIGQYDAYKVESVGDSYMVVSGLPNRNGNAHSGIIATMALHFLYIVSKFKMQQNPDAVVQLRIGINTGPVVAGVVGLKMPRYCLFGDTVNTSSRMESSGGGRAMGIQVSESTYFALQQIGGYHLKLRGEISVK